MKKKIAILGSTGSIGKTLFNILKKDRINFEISLLTTNTNYKELLKQIKIFDVKNIIITDKVAFTSISKVLKNKKIHIHNSFDSINKIFKKNDIDYVMNSVSGFSGLKPTLEIIKFCKKIAIANKESIICGWSLIEKNLKKYRTQFVPVDSEHFSIWSLINGSKNENIEKIFITASGGPFRNLPLNQFKSITKKMALKHPNWVMGKKISIDSATMMNKVFEIIEAKKIFNFSYKQLEIIVHPQSYLHAIIKFSNGLTKLLIHDTNMIIPIFNSLHSGTKHNIKSKQLDFNKLNNLNIKYINKDKFPVVRILDNLKNKDSLFETVIVSANDSLVHLFLEDKIKFTDISKILLKTLNMREFVKYKSITPRNIEEITKLSNYVSLKINSMSV